MGLGRRRKNRVDEENARGPFIGLGLRILLLQFISLIDKTYI